jgi:hypothetical protein
VWMIQIPIYGMWTRIIAVDDAIRCAVGQAREAQCRGGQSGNDRG